METTTETTEYLTELVVPRRKTGVIVGVERGTTAEELRFFADQLRAMFPAVQIAFVTGAHSVAFEWDEEGEA